MKRRKKVLASILAILCMSIMLQGCNTTAKQEKNTNGQSVEKQHLTLSVGAKNLEVAEWLQEKMEPYGYEIEIVMITGALVPADAISNDELDMTLGYQLSWLNNYNKKNGTNLQMIEHLYYSNNAIFSSKHASFDEVPDKATVVLPSDSVNMERTLMILNDADLITLGNKSSDFYTIVDIKDNPKNLQIVEAERAAVVSSYNDADLIVTGAVEMQEAGFDADSYLFVDQHGAEYPHGIIVNANALDSEWVKTIIQLCHTGEFKTMYNEHYKGTHVLIN